MIGRPENNTPQEGKRTSRAKKNDAMCLRTKSTKILQLSAALLLSLAAAFGRGLAK